MSNQINVTFIHPMHGQEIEVEIDDTFTANDTINKLVRSNFLRHTENGYRLIIRDTCIEIAGAQTLEVGGTKNGSLILPVFNMVTG